MRLMKKEMKENIEILQDRLKGKDKEIERLNNIINELEKYIGIKMNSFGICNASDIYLKLKELKGDDKM